MPRRATAAEAIARIAALPGGRLQFVGIDGPGGAGKSTLADAAAAVLPAASLIRIDDFSGPDFEEWDWARLGIQVVDPLLAGRAARYQRWNWDHNTPGEWVDVPPDGLVVVEGVSSTRREAAVPWALTIWVDTPPELRRARAIARDGEAMWPTWRDHWIPNEQAYVTREQPQDRVDLVVSGEDRGSLTGR